MNITTLRNSTDVDGFVANYAMSIAGLYSVLGVLANLLTIIAFTRQKNLRTNATTLFIINVCISNLIFSSINLPINTIFYYSKYWIFGDVLCKIYVLLYTIDIFSSWFGIMTVTINRYILICKPEIYGKIYTSRNVKIMISIIWIIPFFIFAMSLTELYGKVGQSSKSLICTMLPKNGHDIRLISTLASFIIPFTVTLITFFLIYKKVRFNDSTKESNGQENEVNDLSMFKIMLVIFICLLICYLPKPLLAVFDDNRDYPKLNVIGESIYWTHVFTNPIIFFFTGKLYREAYRQMMFSSGQKKPSDN